MTTESILLIGCKTRNVRDVLEAYADPLGDHPRITDAVHAEVEKQQVLAVEDPTSAAPFEAGLTRTKRPVATDGEGGPRT